MSVPWYLMAKGKGGGGYKIASGPIVSVNDALAAPLRSLSIGIDPVQSGSGDPSPDNVRPITGWSAANLWKTGKNLLAKPFAYRPVPSQLSDCFFAKAGTYNFSFSTIGTATKWRFGISLFDGSGNALRDSQHSPTAALAFNNTLKMWYSGNDSTVKSLPFTLATDCYIRIWFGSGDTSSDMVATDAQLELGSTATAYAPYSGTTYPITIPALGKNLLAPAFSAGTTKTANDVNYLFNSDGTVSVSGTCSGTNSWQDVVSYFSLPAGTYTLSGGVSNSIYLSLRDYNNVSLATSKSGAETITISETTTVRVRACVLANTVVPSNTVLHPMLELGSTATEYEPYTNTVYEGYIQVGADGSAELVATHAEVDMSTLSWSKGQAETQVLGNYAYFNAAPSAKKAGNANFISSSYRAVDSNRNNLYNGQMGVYNKNSSGYRQFAVRNDAYADSTGTEFATAMSGQTIVYELDTPLHYPLSSIAITTLKGENVVWADCGEVDVEYLSSGGANPDLMKLAVAFMGRE